MKPLSERYSTIIGMVALGQPGDTDRDVWHEVAALEARVEALERARRATEVINTTTHEASKGVYLGKPCAHGNLPVYPTHARWCDECWQELEDALAVLRGEEGRDDGRLGSFALP